MMIAYQAFDFADGKKGENIPLQAVVSAVAWWAYLENHAGIFINDVSDSHLFGRKDIRN